MGKISDALEKALEREDQAAKLERVQPVEESHSTPPPSSPQPTASPKNHQPPAEQIWDARLFKAVNEDHYIPEVIKTLRSRILHPKEGKAVPKTILVTSVSPKEGKTFITANLGVSLAQGLEQHSLLVNCDLRRPSLASLFGLENTHGLVDYLRNEIDIPGIIKKTSVDKLSLLPCGKPPANPAELLGSSRMQALLDELSQRYDDRFIIFDSPPFELAAESAVLAKMVDSVVLVVREGGAARHQVKKLIDKIGQDRVLGVVFNGHTTNIVERTLMKGYGSYASYDAYK